jgi:hypothetical protein
VPLSPHTVAPARTKHGHLATLACSVGSAARCVGMRRRAHQPHFEYEGIAAHTASARTASAHTASAHTASARTAFERTALTAAHASRRAHAK